MEEEESPFKTAIDAVLDYTGNGSLWATIPVADLKDSAEPEIQIKIEPESKSRPHRPGTLLDVVDMFKSVTLDDLSDAATKTVKDLDWAFSAFKNGFPGMGGPKGPTPSMGSVTILSNAPPLPRMGIGDLSIVESRPDPEGAKKRREDALDSGAELGTYWVGVNKKMEDDSIEDDEPLLSFDELAAERMGHNSPNEKNYRDIPRRDDVRTVELFKDPKSAGRFGKAVEFDVPEDASIIETHRNGEPQMIDQATLDIMERNLGPIMEDPNPDLPGLKSQKPTLGGIPRTPFRASVDTVYDKTLPGVQDLIDEARDGMEADEFLRRMNQLVKPDKMGGLEPHVLDFFADDPTYMSGKLNRRADGSELYTEIMKALGINGVKEPGSLELFTWPGYARMKQR